MSARSALQCTILTEGILGGSLLTDGEQGLAGGYYLHLYLYLIHPDIVSLRTSCSQTKATIRGIHDTYTHAWTHIF